MVGNILKDRLEARRSGAKDLASTAVSNVKALLGDIKERADLDRNVPKSLSMEIPRDAVRRVIDNVSDSEKRFAANNRIGLGR
jgi:hypothetical protein